MVPPKKRQRGERFFHINAKNHDHGLQQQYRTGKTTQRDPARAVKMPEMKPSPTSNPGRRFVSSASASPLAFTLHHHHGSMPKPQLKTSAWAYPSIHARTERRKPTTASLSLSSGSRLPLLPHRVAAPSLSPNAEARIRRQIPTLRVFLWISFFGRFLAPMGL